MNMYKEELNILAERSRLNKLFNEEKNIASIVLYFEDMTGIKLSDKGALKAKAILEGRLDEEGIKSISETMYEANCVVSTFVEELNLR